MIQELRCEHSVQLHRHWHSCIAQLCAPHKPDTVVVCFTSLLAPIMLLLRIVHPEVGLRYMVRGDEITEADHAGRRVRRCLAWLAQAAMARAGIRFIFASRDLLMRFESRFALRDPRVLPNTAGHCCGPFRPFNGHIAVVGDFGTVKNIEFALSELRNGPWTVHLFGASVAPAALDWAGLVQHGLVDDLSEHLARTASIVVMPSISEGFPNVLIDALEAGCGVIAASDYPFSQLPLGPCWKFSRRPGALLTAITRLERRQPDFAAENKELLAIVAQDWIALVKKALL